MEFMTQFRQKLDGDLLRGLLLNTVNLNSIVVAGAQNVVLHITIWLYGNSQAQNATWIVCFDF